MSYTILSAAYANSQSTAAIVMTQEAGAILLSAADTPADWAAMQAWGVPSAYVPPAPSLAPLSRVQFFQVLALNGLITQDEALAAVAGGTIPAGFSAFIASLPDDQQFSFKMLLSGSQTFERDHPFVTTFAASRSPPMTGAQVDALWVQGAALS